MVDTSEVTADTATTTEAKDSAGTAPKLPNDKAVQAAHATYEERKAKAEDIQADMEEAQARGANPKQAKLYAQMRNAGPAPENRALTGAPDNRGA